MWLPGIPAVGAPARSIFMRTFWSSLDAGIVSSVLTGIVVGLALLVVQRSVDANRTRREYEREISILRQRLRTAMAVESPFRLDDAMASVPQRAEAAIDIMADLPVSMWEREMPSHRRVLAKAVALQREFAEFKTAAQNLDTALRGFARHFHSERNIDSFNDSMLAQFLLGCLAGFDEDDVIRWIPPGSRVAVPERFSEALAEARDQSAVMEVFEAYWKARTQLERDADELKESVD